ncbi:DUF3617 domain-containing protein [Asticcacaulis excentricus]|uniref:DUF3617 family protein n=1 Tax=Asticcacaulis excentricus (strain ATCC 15261 / DSM 4724 / KCTC 12464 / NCIMB 9791 / VKM B-1370 / CB 48) TaxID=573065 RepID=E8RRN8_ASTEC|nr:DUF3617 family protein [Asticcacaulis excentricus]ADU12359.1 Protein of unknown function DUF3617 [Asticcacaulis excentricus CB 48]
MAAYVKSGVVLSWLAVVGLMSGCGKKEQPPAPEPTPASASVAAPPAKPQEPLPTRQPGLWETTLSEEGSESQAQTMRICLDAATEKELGITGTDLNGNRCRNTAVSHLDDGSWGILAECNMGSGGKMEVSGSITGDYTRDYTMTLRSQTTGASLAHMNRVVNMTIRSKRLGACKADQKPGDVTLPGGDVSFNLFDMAGREPGPPK